MADISVSMRFSEEEALALALKEARKGLGYVEPNPPVGCVILDSNYHILSSGYHKKYGSGHAETEALRKIRDKNQLEGAHIFVTMEPCHHTGKTSSCAQMLSELPLSSLTYAVKDPFTNGKGLNFLRKRGIKIVQSKYFRKELEELVWPFTFSFVEKRSFVSLKVATSLDGVIASKNKKWITSSKSREHSHLLRARHSAILIGVQTLLKDNPRLNIRQAPFKHKKNKIIILDPYGKSLAFLPKSQLLKVHTPSDLIICCSRHKESTSFKKKALSLGVNLKFFKILGKKKCFNLKKLLKNFYKEDKIQSVMVEGGGFTLSQFLQTEISQKFYLYQAPKILGEGVRWGSNTRAVKLKRLQTHEMEEGELLLEFTF